MEEKLILLHAKTSLFPLIFLFFPLYFVHHSLQKQSIGELPANLQIAIVMRGRGSASLREDDLMHLQWKNESDAHFTTHLLPLVICSNRTLTFTNLLMIREKNHDFWGPNPFFSFHFLEYLYLFPAHVRKWDYFFYPKRWREWDVTKKLPRRPLPLLIW